MMRSNSCVQLWIIVALFVASPSLAAGGASPITASQGHGMVLQGGEVCVAGQNEYGELGNGNYVSQLSPVPAVLPPGIKAVSTGWYHSLAVDATGTVWAWGNNAYGELGDGTTISKATPNPVPNFTGVIAVAAGQYYSLALKSDGTVWGWGYNGNGELGNGTTTSSSTPVQVSQVTNVIAIAAGSNFGLALESNGTVWAWGYGPYGEIGNGASSSVLSPVQTINLTNVIAIAAGANHSLALKSDGSVWAWGYNGYGQLGDSTTTSRSTPAAIVGLSGISAIAAGDNHSLAVATNGTGYAWGQNNQGQLGNGTYTNSSMPVQVTGLNGAIAVAGGTAFSQALTSNGAVYAWGINTYGQLGNGTTSGSATPVAASGCAGLPAPQPLSGVTTKLSASESTSIAVQSTGIVWAWGDNTHGQIGDGSTTNRLVPVQAAGPTGVMQVAEGWYHSLALQSNGTVWAWGYNAYGELGDGTTTNRLAPVQLPNLSNVTAVAAGQYHSLALKSDGTVWGWGYNGNGQLGDDSTTSSTTPVQVSQVSHVIAIAAGSNFSLAVESNGTVWAWGYGPYGEIGNGANSTVTIPVQVIDLSDVTTIAAGANHALAIKSDGTVWAWGYNGYGQLGDGTTTSQSTVVRVSGLTDIIAIAGGDNHTLAVKSDGTVWAWGYNNAGQLGNGTTTNASTPVQVSGLSGALAVAAGTSYSLALKSDGSIWAWGANSSGQFGNNTTSGTNTPLQGPTIGQIFTFTYNLSPSNSGTVIADPPSPDGTYLSGTQVCFTPVPNSGYAFSNWTGVTLNSSNCLTAAANTVVSANFVPVGLHFVPVAPCRIADTRNPDGPFGGPSTFGGTSRDFVIPNSACNIPSSAAAYSLNVTVVPSGPLGYVTIWPTGQSQPFVSTLNSFDGRIKANAAIVTAGTSGAVSVYASNTTDVVLDINGYFTSASSTAALAFYPVTPCRLVDTRISNGSLGSPSLTAGVARDFPLLTSTCNIPNTAQAYSLNFTAVPPGALSFITVWPTGQTQPFVSTLNDILAQVVANAAIVPAGANGDIDVAASNNTDLVIDINGYFAPAGTGGLSFYTAPPCRVIDTRQSPGAQPAGGELTVNVSGSACAPPGTARAYVFNATVVPPSVLAFLSLWPDGQSQPTVSTLNAFDGSVTSNMAIVPTSNGMIDAFAYNPTYVILDLSGYFAP